MGARCQLFEFVSLTFGELSRYRRKAPYVTLGHLCHAAYHDVVLVTAADPHKLSSANHPSLGCCGKRLGGEGGGGFGSGAGNQFPSSAERGKNGSKQGGGGIRKRRGMRIDAPHPRGNKVVRLSPELSTATHHNLQKKSNIAATPPHRNRLPTAWGGMFATAKKMQF